MHDKGKILIGIAIFLVLVLFPVWFALAGGGTGVMPKLDVGTDKEACIADTQWMRANHMDLLNEWRDDVVRGTGDPYHVDKDKVRHEKSLTRTCLGCHTNMQGFCARCHDYMGVEPYCWDCHIDPKTLSGGN